MSTYPVPKIWFFDLEGTILKKESSLDNGKVAPSAWTVLAKELGNGCYLEEELSKDKWLSGGYTGYLDWMRDSVLILQRHGLQRAHIETLVSNMEMHNGAKELFELLNSIGVVTVLISGGFKALADKVQRELKINHSFSGCELFFDSSGKLESFNLLPTDNEGKVAFMQLVAREYGMGPENCVFVGDGKNDIYLAKAVGFSVAFNAQPELIETATLSVKQKEDNENLLEVYEEILNFIAHSMN